jgi:DNA modification methylase
MTPYFSEHGFELYLGDCTQVCAVLPRNSMHLMVTDPPYGVKWQSGRRSLKFDQIKNDDGTLNLPAAIDICVRLLLRDHRHAYVFAKPHTLGGTRLQNLTELVWDKQMPGLGDLTSPWGPQHEIITFGIKGSKSQTAECGLAARLRRGSVLRVTRLVGTSVAKHPTEKPVALLRQLIESSSSFGERVFDPFTGSGSTLVAAAKEERVATGIELDEQYCETAANWLREVLGAGGA